MKKLLTVVFLLFFCIYTYGSSTDFIKARATMEVEYSDTFDETIYPSYIYTATEITRSTGQKKATLFFGLNINTNKQGNYKIVVKENILTDETVLNISLNKGQNEVPLYLNWKLNDFIYLRKPGFATFNVKLIDNDTDQEITNASKLLGYRSTNECVYGLMFGNVFSSTGQFFLAYVNEDKTELIDPFLSAARDNFNKKLGRNNAFKLTGWQGYQGGSLAVSQQILAIVQELNRRGFSYSSITTSSNFSKKVASQYVRFIDESMFYTEANCADGTVLLASILTKIGIKCALVIVPGHMYLAYKASPDTSYYTTLETTAIGNDMSNPETYTKGLYANNEEFNRLFFKTKKFQENKAYQLIPVKHWRQYVKPIQ